MDGRLDSVADAIESQCCVEIRGAGAMQGAVRPLALAARAKQNGAPVLLAAQRLKDAVKPGDVVIVSTGFYVPEVMPCGETDGPPGAAALAFALREGLGAVPYLLAEASTLGPSRAACRTLGLMERDLTGARHDARSFAASPFPADESAEETAAQLMAHLAPSAVITTERPGVNRLGVAHRGGGKSIPYGRARIETLTGLASQTGVPFIAIGDNGNEAGLGLIADEVRRYKAFGDRCQCPCGGGIAAVDVADVTVVGSVSNWAAYGIVACLAAILGRDDLLHDAATEERLIRACLEAGAVDGITLSNQLTVDAIPAPVNGAVVTILRAVVQAAVHG